MIVPTKETFKGQIIGDEGGCDHVFHHTEDGFDIYVDDNGFPCEETQKVFTCRCRAWYIEYTVYSYKDATQELAEELENELEA